MQGASGWVDRTQNSSTRGGGGLCVYINKYSGWSDAKMLTVQSAQSVHLLYIHFFCCLHSLRCKLKPQELCMTLHVLWQNLMEWNGSV